LSSAVSDYESSVAKLRQAEANNEKSQTDLVRYKELLDKQEIAHSDYDQYLANAKSQQANVNSASAAAASSQKVIDQRNAQLAQQRSKLSQTAANAPRQIEIKRGKHRQPQSQCRVLSGPTRSGPPQYRLLPCRGARQRHRDAT
jgi:membrane fusion protein (multidrug efflux system)